MINTTHKAIAIALTVVFVGGQIPVAQAALNVPISRPVTVEATVAGTNVLNVNILNKSDQQVAGKVTFTNPDGYLGGNQVLEVEFSSNNASSRVVIRTDNKNATANPKFTGDGEGAGLVGTTETTRTAPLLWVVYDDFSAAKDFAFKGDTDPAGDKVGSLPNAQEQGAGIAEGLVVDKANPDYETEDVLGYATVVIPDASKGNVGSIGNFPVDEDGAGPKTGLRSATSPIYVGLGGGFVGLPAQKYSSGTLALDLIVQ